MFIFPLSFGVYEVICVQILVKVWYRYCCDVNIDSQNDFLLSVFLPFSINEKWILSVGQLCVFLMSLR